MNGDGVSGQRTRTKAGAYQYDRLYTLISQTIPMYMYDDPGEGAEISWSSTRVLYYQYQKIGKLDWKKKEHACPDPPLSPSGAEQKLYCTGTRMKCNTVLEARQTLLSNILYIYIYIYM
jgi:hypothetical protein